MLLVEAGQVLFFRFFSLDHFSSLGIYEELNPVPKPNTDCVSFTPFQAGKLDR